MVPQVEVVLDELLVLLAQQGEPGALDRLAKRWHGRHYAHARRLLGADDGAADAVQDAWVGIIRGLGRLRDPARFRAWSFAIVTRRCQDALRRRAREPVAETPSDIPDPRSPDPGRSHDLRRGLARLPPDQRAAIALYYGQGMGVAEIAEALGVPPGTVKSRLYHARRSLRRHFQ